MMRHTVIVFFATVAALAPLAFGADAPPPPPDLQNTDTLETMARLEAQQKAVNSYAADLTHRLELLKKLKTAADESVATAEERSVDHLKNLGKDVRDGFTATDDGERIKKIIDGWKQKYAAEDALLDKYYSDKPAEIAAEIDKTNQAIEKNNHRSGIIEADRAKLNAPPQWFTDALAKLSQLQADQEKQQAEVDRQHQREQQAAADVEQERIRNANAAKAQQERDAWLKKTLAEQRQREKDRQAETAKQEAEAQARWAAMKQKEVDAAAKQKADQEKAEADRRKQEAQQRERETLARHERERQAAENAAAAERARKQKEAATPNPGSAGSRTVITITPSSTSTPIPLRHP